MNHEPRPVIALLRELSPRLGECELTHVSRSPIDLDKARAEHTAYARTLELLGVRLEYLPSLPDGPDGVFVEDIALVLPEIVVITRPGANSRLCEVESVAHALGRHRPVIRLCAPNCLKGGDVLRIDRTLYVGASNRTNASGILALQEALLPHNYDVRVVTIQGCLHLKTACTFIPPCFILANPRWVNVNHFRGLAIIATDEKEPFAANTLTVGQTTLVSASYPRTEELLRSAKIATRALDISELHKAEAGLTCLSLLLEPAIRPVREEAPNNGSNARPPQRATMAA